MQTGLKGRGVRREKLLVARHTSRMRHGKGRSVEKAIETKERRQGRKACEGDS